MEFSSNMVLPVFATTAMNLIVMFAYYGSELFTASSGSAENMGILFGGNRTLEMLAQERAYYARAAAKKEAMEASGEMHIIESEGESDRSWSLWSKLQVLVVILFLICFAAGFDVCVVSIAAGCNF